MGPSTLAPAPPAPHCCQMQLDRNGLEVLSRGECLQLLARSRVGRVVVTDRALPAAFPVNFALLDTDVVFLTSAGSKLEAAEGEEVMAFEVDDIDPASQSGWSVLVQGLASVIDDPEDLARARDLGLEPWAPAARSHSCASAPSWCPGADCSPDRWPPPCRSPTWASTSRTSPVAHPVAPTSSSR